MVAVDGDGAVGPESTLTVLFDRSCLVLPDILTLAAQSEVDRLAVCTSLRTSTRVDIVGGGVASEDPITSLLPMSNITVSYL